MNINKAVIGLVLFKDFLFPAHKQDVEILLANRVPSTQLHKDVLPLLRHTLGKTCDVEVMPWSEVYPFLREKFLSSLPEGVQHKAESNWILLHQVRTGDSTYAGDKTVQARIAQLQHILSRYCIQATACVKEKSDHKLTKISLVFDNSIANYKYYDNVAVEDEPELNFTLSNQCRLKLSIKKVPVSKYVRARDAEGNPCTKSNVTLTNHLSIEIQDLSGTQFTTAMQRTFPTSNLAVGEIVNLSKFLLSLSGKKG